MNNVVDDEEEEKGEMHQEKSLERAFESKLPTAMISNNETKKRSSSMRINY